MRRLLHSLYIQVLLAIVAGALLGIFFPDLSVRLRPLGDAFIRLIKMVVAPIVFCTVVTGIAHMRNTRKVGRVGLRALIYFEVVTTLALLIGMLVINLLQPGAGLHLRAEDMDTGAVQQYITRAGASNTSDFLVNLIPDSIVGAFAANNLLQILLFSILMGFALASIGQRAAPLLNGLQSLEDALFRMIRSIMKLAPIGAFGAMAFTIGKYGFGSLAQLGQLLLAFYLTCSLFIVLVLGGILHLAGYNIFRLLAYLREELLLVLGTSSSESAMPGLIDKLEKLGCSEPVVGLVVPTGYSFNLDGTCIYLTMAAVFLAQATDTPMDIAQQASLLLVLLLTSKGAAGVTGSGFITLAATLPVAGHIPVAAISLLLGIDRFMSEGRALTNLTGNAVATIVIAGWEKEIDKGKAKALIG
jgi:aerobic C4-dicarboxylate transport protein